MQNNQPKLIYFVQYDSILRECYSIVITNDKSRIISIINPYCKHNREKQDQLNVNFTEDLYDLVVDRINCSSNNGNEHSIGDIYNSEMDCCRKFPNDIHEFNDINELLEYISNIYKGGNPGIWAGNQLWITADEDYELYGIYKDVTTGMIYGQWVSTHQTINLPVPRILEFYSNDNDNKINILLEYDDEYNGIKISYNGYIAYSNRSLIQDVTYRISHLLLPPLRQSKVNDNDNNNDNEIETFQN